MRLIILIILSGLFFACKKDPFTNSKGALLTASIDTVRFDTVFTSTGSITQICKIFNTNDEGIHVSSVHLKGGNASPFVINVNGVTGPVVSNLDIPANDSAYIFITVKINPSADNLPFIARDSVEISYNGNNSRIQLEAYGQNAHFFRKRVITGNEIWENDLPYVILGGLEIAPAGHLTIESGCKVYAHEDAPVVVKGSLTIAGTSASRVTFNGDRLDIPYKNFPGSWPGIIFTRESKNNNISYTDIKNTFQGIVITDPSSNSNPKLILNETIIDNAFDAGLLAINTSIRAKNLLISNCAANMALFGGGDYQFAHCTLAGYSNNLVIHKQPVLQVRNFYQQDGASISNALSAVFQNCIFWGESSIIPDEVVVSKEGNASFSVLFDHVLWKVQNTPTNVTTQSAINNEQPQFEIINPERNIFNFRLKETSPAVDQGKSSSVNNDLEGNPRPVGVPDLGCYERQ